MASPVSGSPAPSRTTRHFGLNRSQIANAVKVVAVIVILSILLLGAYFLVTNSEVKRFSASLVNFYKIQFHLSDLGLIGIIIALIVIVIISIVITYKIIRGIATQGIVGYITGVLRNVWSWFKGILNLFSGLVIASVVLSGILLSIILIGNNLDKPITEIPRLGRGIILAIMVIATLISLVSSVKQSHKTMGILYFGLAAAIWLISTFNTIAAGFTGINTPIGFFIPVEFAGPAILISLLLSAMFFLRSWTGRSLS